LVHLKRLGESAPCREKEVQKHVRVEVVRELDPCDDILELPWAASENSAPLYVDLKRFPGRVDELKECRRHPAVRELLRLLNRPKTALRTVKCDVWKTTKLAEDERADFNLAYKLGAYLDVVLEDPTLRAQLTPHVRWAARIARRLAPARLQAQIEIVVRTCLFHSEEKWGYALTVFVHGYGSSWDEAESEWGGALVHLGKALLKTPTRTPRRVHGRKMRARAAGLTWSGANTA
jgi:hypothetical protein